MKQYGYYTCKKCGVSKPLTPQYFYKFSLTRTGFLHICIECKKIYGREYYGAPKHGTQEKKLYKGPPQREKMLAHMKVYYSQPKVREGYIKYQKIYRNHPIHKEKMLASKRAKYANDPEYREKALARHREWYFKNKEKMSEYNKAWRLRNKEKLNERSRRYRERKKIERSKK